MLINIDFAVGMFFLYIALLTLIYFGIAMFAILDVYVKMVPRENIAEFFIYAVVSLIMYCIILDCGKILVNQPTEPRFFDFFIVGLFTVASGIALDKVPDFFREHLLK